MKGGREMKTPRITIDFTDVIKVVHHDTAEGLIYQLHHDGFEYKDGMSLEEYIDSVVEKSAKIYSDLLKFELYKRLGNVLDQMNQH